jgi:hypothetical protein
VLAAACAYPVAVVNVLMSTVTVDAASGLPDTSRIEPGKKLKLSAILLRDELLRKVIM